MNHKERMLKELPYKPWLDGLDGERLKTKILVHKYNQCNPARSKKRRKLLERILGKKPSNIHIEPPFYCDYGKNIEFHGNFYANHNLVILDVAKVIIGDNVQCGPNVSITTAGHPIHPESRNSGYEFGIKIEIEDNVWVGSNVVINPGVKIGKNSVIGSGAVVTKDIPANVVAAGNPCRVLREITEDDRNYYYKIREFDVTDY